MLSWLPHDEGLATIKYETDAAIEVARWSNSANAGPGILARLSGPIRRRLADRHSVTDYPCRLPDGRMGRTSIRLLDGEWVAVCVR